MVMTSDRTARAEILLDAAHRWPAAPALLRTADRVLGVPAPAGGRPTARIATYLLAGGVAMAAAPTHAHLVETGFGAFYDGLAHVALTPADLLVVIALALLAGQRGTRTARWTLFAFPIAWLASGAVGARFPDESTLPLLTTLTFACTGLLVALDVKLRAVAVSMFAIAAGLLHGYANGASMASGEASGLGLAGIATAIFCLFAILSAQVTTPRAGWSRVAVRVVGSWIAATGVLMLGWLVHSLV
jgi:urease accessory protein